MPSEDYKSIPVEYVVSSKNASDLDLRVSYTSINQFRPFRSLERKDFLVPTGVYCPGRKNLKPVPKIPQSFLFTVQLVNNTLDRSGFAIHFRVNRIILLNLLTFLV